MSSIVTTIQVHITLQLNSFFLLIFIWINPVMHEHKMLVDLLRMFVVQVSIGAVRCFWVHACSYANSACVGLKERAVGLTFDPEKAWTGAMSALWFNLCVAHISNVLLYMTVNLIL